MRCYFMRRGHIQAVEIIENAKDDDEAIRRAKELLAAAQMVKKPGLPPDGFELWDRARFIKRYPSNDNGEQNGGKNRKA